MTSIRRVIKASTPLAIVCVFIFMLNSSASAQWALEVERPWSSMFAEDDIERLIEMVNLSDMQSFSVRHMFKDHASDFREKVFTLRSRAEDLKTQQRLRELISTTVEWYKLEEKRYDLILQASDRMQELDQSLLQSVKSILHESQLEGFQRFTYRMNRNCWLARHIYYAEERVDLIAVIDAIELQDSEIVDKAAYRQLVCDYESQFDTLLQKKFDFYRAQAREWLDVKRKRIHVKGDNVYIGSHPDPNWSLKAQRKKRVSGKKVIHERARALNRQYRDFILTTISPESAERLLAAYRVAVWPHVYDPQFSPGLRYLLKIEQLEALTDDQRLTISALRDDYELHLSHYAESIIHAANEFASSHFRDFDRIKQERFMQRYDDAIQKRHDYEHRFARRIWGQLTIAQQEEHPVPAKVTLSRRQ